MDNIQVIDNFLKDEELDKIVNIIKKMDWVYGEVSNGIETKDTPFFKIDLSGEKFISEELLFKIEKQFNRKFKINRVYVNGQVFGQDGSYHIDDKDDKCYTFCLYIHKINNEDIESYGGNLLIKLMNEKKHIFIEPLFNRGVLFPSFYLHKGMAFNRYNSNMRISIAWKLQEKHQKVHEKEEEIFELNDNAIINSIVIDNVYLNPEIVREYAVDSYDYSYKYPYGRRTNTAYRNNITKNWLEKYSGKIKFFNLCDNGTFLFTNPIENGKWVHTDEMSTWAGVLYLNPNAPIECGTGLYEYYKGGVRYREEAREQFLVDDIHNDRTNEEKWKYVNRFGNIYNRLILYKTNNFHKMVKHFGNTRHDCRLVQTFFFTPFENK